MIVSHDEIMASNNQFYYFISHKVPFAFRQRAVEIVDIADVQDLEVWGERYCQITNKFAHVNKRVICYLWLNLTSFFFRDDGLVAAVCGVGLQTFSLLGHTWYVKVLYAFSFQSKSEPWAAWTVLCLLGNKQDNKYWTTETGSEHRLFASIYIIYVHSPSCFSFSYFINGKSIVVVK